MDRKWDQDDEVLVRVEMELEMGALDVLDRVVVKQKVDAREELPDEASWYAKATMTGAKRKTGMKMSQGSKMPEVAKIDEIAATWGRQDRQKG